MENSDIDYSNTIIYKITCRTPGIKDVYVGYTTNFVQRRRAHKQSCNNPKSGKYQCKLYATIKENGGWNNWKMNIVHFCNCANQFEARKFEQEYVVLLRATLNSIEPMPSSKVNKPPVTEPSYKEIVMMLLKQNATLLETNEGLIKQYKFC